MISFLKEWFKKKIIFHWQACRMMRHIQDFQFKFSDMQICKTTDQTRPNRDSYWSRLKLIVPYIRKVFPAAAQTLYENRMHSINMLRRTNLSLRLFEHYNSSSMGMLYSIFKNWYILHFVWRLDYFTQWTISSKIFLKNWKLNHNI